MDPNAEGDDPSGQDYLTRGLEAALSRVDVGALIRRDQEHDRVEEVSDELPLIVDGMELLKEIGRGGIGVVYIARDLALGRDLAVKAPLKKYAGNDRILEQFREEARTNSQLQHPGIVPVHSTGYLPDGRPYFSMKVIEGQTLLELMSTLPDAREGSRRRLEILCEACRVIAFAHTRGVIHGDLKPSNVMIGSFGEIQVVDWGFSREVAGEESDIATDGLPFGTPAYMAPEQACGDAKRITKRTDVFGLGALGFELLTGAPPYVGRTRSEVYSSAQHGAVESACSILDHSSVDASIADLIQRCLRPEPKQRPSDAAELHAELVAYLEALDKKSRVLEDRLAQARMKEREALMARRATLIVSIGLFVLLVGVAWLERRKVGQEREAQKAVDSAAYRAEQLLIRAQSQPPNEIRFWDAAVESIEQASQIAEAGRIDAATRRETEALLKDARQQRSAAHATRDLAKWLAQIRLDIFLFATKATQPAAYEVGFAEHGFSLDDEATPRRIAQSRVATSLCRAFDEYAHRVSQGGSREKGKLEQIHRILEVADPDPQRIRLRTAMREGDDAFLRESFRMHLEGLPQATVSLLVLCLWNRGLGEDAVEALRRFISIEPGESWALHDLAVILLQSEAPPHDEIRGLTQALVALNPRNVHALSDHGVALRRVGALHLARASQSKAVEIDPNYSRAWIGLANVCRDLCDHEGSLAAISQAVRLEPRVPGIWALKREAHVLNGDVARALEAAQVAHDLRPTSHNDAAQLGRLLSYQQEWEAAEAAYRAAIKRRSMLYAPYMRALTEILARQGRFEDARDELAATVDEARRRGDEALVARLVPLLQIAKGRARMSKYPTDLETAVDGLGPGDLARWAECSLVRQDWRSAYLAFRELGELDELPLSGFRCWAVESAARVALSTPEEGVSTELALSAARDVLTWVMEEVRRAEEGAHKDSHSRLEMLNAWARERLLTLPLRRLWMSPRIESGSPEAALREDVRGKLRGLLDRMLSRVTRW